MSMSINIEIIPDDRPDPKDASAEELLIIRMWEQRQIINALEVEKSKAKDRLHFLNSVFTGATPVSPNVPF